MTRFVLLAAAGCLAAQELRVGAAQTGITPEPGTPMAGYYNTRLMTGVHDPLFAKAIVIESGGARAALVSCDLIGLPQHVIAEARRIAARETKIPAAHIMISATHSHTGPVVTGRSARDGSYGGSLEITKKYMAELPARIAASVKQAEANLAPALASWSIGREESIAFNRRFHMKDGTVGWNPGKMNPNIVKTVGPTDPAVPLVYFETAERRPLAVYWNYAMHLDTVGGLDASADYPATVASLLSKMKDAGMLTLFTMGTSGNINHIDVSHKTPQKGHAEAERLGTVLAGELLKAFTRRTQAPAGLLQVRSEIVPLALAEVSESDIETARSVAAAVDKGETTKFLDTVAAFKALDVAARKGEPLEAEVQVISLGDQIAWVALPGEVFVELGLAIKQGSPFPQTIVAELAHGPVTYLPDARAFPQGNYEVVSSRAARGSGERLVESAIRQLKALHAGARPGGATR